MADWQQEDLEKKGTEGKKKVAKQNLYCLEIQIGFGQRQPS